MIPHRIKLSGFLSYRDEQEIRLDGSQLWMLSGLNGSGKSTVFDAVTYALFGHHRGGQLQSVELINKDSRALAVEFDFRIDRDLFRIKRTLKRTAKGSATGTQQIYEWQHDPFADGGDWMPIPDTNRKVEFDNWVRERIGLTYDTFTSSVLLLQGKAEKLLDSKPSGRAEVLAGIVDLERYQRLHERADNRRRALRAQLEAVQNQSAAVPEVTDLELLAAQGHIEDASESHQKALAEVERLQALEYDARQWVEHRKRLAGLRDRFAQAQALLGDAAQIEKDFARLRELQDVLPHVLAIQEHDRSIAESEGKSKQLAADRDAAAHKKAALEHTLELARQKRTSLQKTILGDEQKIQGVEKDLRELSGLLEKVRLLEDHQARVGQLEAEVARLPSAPDQEVRRLQALHDQRVEQTQVLPVLERFQQARADLTGARQRLAAAEEKAATITRSGDVAREESRSLRAQAEAAAKARAEADERATEARTFAERAKAELQELESLQGKKSCRHCGQPLTAGHLQEEKKRRETAVFDTERRYRELAAIQDQARAGERDAAAAAQRRDQEYQQLKQDYRDCQRDVQEARKEAERATLDCRNAYLSLPEPVGRRIAPGLLEDWLESEFPSRADLSAFRKETAELENVRRQLRTAQSQLNAWTALQAQLAATRQTVTRLSQELPQGAAGLRERFASLRGEEESLGASLRGGKKTLRETEAEVERLTRDVTVVGNLIGDLTGKLGSEEVARKHLSDARDRARLALPAPWRAESARAGLAEQLRWKMERDELVAAGVEARYQQLASARVGTEGLTEEIARLEQEGERFPEPARQAPETVRAQWQEQKQELARRDQELKAAQQEKAILDRHRQHRDQLRAQTLELERDLNYWSLLAQLLGRDRLQRHLVRVAERQIVDYANGVLDRLSAGQLFLRLCGGDEGAGTERALDLEACNRTTGGNAINVAFLSGSQRFRVAVSLALGIGQYASRQHRPIESVIIDEGFGCLDRQGRQVMIQELQNLRGHLHCILLVSHQEEFADAFPDGYRFELENGATRVTRLQR